MFRFPFAQHWWFWTKAFEFLLIPFVPGLGLILDILQIVMNFTESHKDETIGHRTLHIVPTTLGSTFLELAIVDKTFQGLLFFSKLQEFQWLVIFVFVVSSYPSSITSKPRSLNKSLVSTSYSGMYSSENLTSQKRHNQFTRFCVFLTGRYLSLFGYKFFLIRYFCRLRNFFQVKRWTSSIHTFHYRLSCPLLFQCF